MFKFRIIFSSLLLFHLGLFCQQVPSFIKNITYPSPTAASLGKYADFPVSYHTGIPQINIPLCTINQGAVKLDLSLSYHASGIKVSELASWVGLGWTLNAGGCITRTIMGEPDEATHQPSGNGYGPGGYYRAYGLSTLPPLNIDITEPGYHKLDMYNDIAAGYSDCEPDLFFFNFNGHVGKFVFDENRTPRLLTDDNLKIEPIYTGEFSSWIITTAEGIRYYFGEGNSKEKTRSYSNQSGDNFNDNAYSSWFLSKIISPDTKDTVYFDYRNESYGYYNLPTESFLLTPFDILCSLNNTIAIVKTYVMGVQLSQIRTINSTVVFEANTPRADLADPNIVSAAINTDAKRLENIKIYSSANQLLKSFAFNYNYFVSSASSGYQHISDVGTSDTKRLKLLSVQEMSASQTIPPYVFEYDETVSLPRRLSCDQDHWGYANGLGSMNQRLTPNVSSNCYGGANRETNVSYVKAWSLNKINYPTGGYSEFSFNVHQTDDPFAAGSGGYVGGLRIQKLITQSNSNAPLIIKEYEYSKALLYSRPQYLIYIQNEYFLTAAGSYSGGGYEVAKILKQSTSIAPMLSVEGSHIGYISVKELNGTEGYTNYTYKSDYKPIQESRLNCYNYINVIGSQANGLFNEIQPENLLYSPYSYIYYPFAPEQTNYDRGWLQSIEVYNKDNNLVKGTTFERFNNLHENYWIRGFKVYKVPKDVNSCNGCDPIYRFNYALCYYKLRTGYSYISKKTETQRDINGNMVTNIINYAYENDVHTLPTRESYTNSKGQSITHKTFYSFDFADNNTSNGVFGKLKKRNLLIPVAERTWKDQELIYGTIKEYKDFSAINTDTILGIANIYALETNKPLVNTTIGENVDPVLPLNTLIPSDQYFKVKVSNKVDVKGNLIEQNRKDNFKKSYWWGYNKTYAIASVVNAASNEIFFDSFEEGTGWDSNLLTFDNSKSHSGSYSGRMDMDGSGEKVCHSATWLNVSLAVSTKYKFSGWIYSNGPTAQIFLFMRRAGETSYFTYVASVITYVTNQWTYVEGEYEVPTDITQLDIRLDNNGDNGGGSVWFDDIRLHPSAAQMTSYTYDPLIGMTSQTDLNNRTIYYEYDSLGRLSIMRDKDRNILKKYCYNYAGQQTPCTE